MENAFKHEKGTVETRLETGPPKVYFPMVKRAVSEVLGVPFSCFLPSDADWDCLSAVCVLELWPEGKKCKEDKHLFLGIFIGSVLMLSTLMAGV